MYLLIYGKLKAYRKMLRASVEQYFQKEHELDRFRASVNLQYKNFMALFLLVSAFLFAVLKKG